VNDEDETFLGVSAVAGAIDEETDGEEDAFTIFSFVLLVEVLDSSSALEPLALAIDTETSERRVSEMGVEDEEWRRTGDGEYCPPPPSPHV